MFCCFLGYLVPLPQGANCFCPKPDTEYSWVILQIALALFVEIKAFTCHRIVGIHAERAY